MTELPIISAAGLASTDAALKAETVNALGRACREVGFFYLVDHGISTEDFAELFGQAKRFFDLPIADKQALSIQRSPHNRGYVGMADEKLNPESGADQKEAFNIGVDMPEGHPDVVAGKPFRGVNYWPALPGWREHMLGYFNQCVEVGRLLHRGFSLDLGLDESFFGQFLTQPIATLRFLHYPQATGAGRHDAGAGAHTDYGNVTLLATDGVAGLEVLTRSGDWLDAPSIPGAFVCNIGDCLMRWSNDTYVSTPHRVRAPKSERYSIAFFLEVNPDAVVDPADIFPDQTPKYPPVTCADYLAQRLDATYGYRVQFNPNGEVNDDTD